MNNGPEKRGSEGSTHEKHSAIPGHFRADICNGFH